MDEEFIVKNLLSLKVLSTKRVFDEVDFRRKISVTSYFVCSRSRPVNHKYDAPVLSGYNARRGTFELVAQADIPKGEQIFIEYGERKDNEYLLLKFGFVLCDLACDKIQISEEDVLLAAEKFPNLRQCTRLGMGRHFPA